MRSLERAQELGEVFTNKREINAMLDLIPNVFTEVTSTFFEPACGNGNFLVEILGRKIELISNDIESESPEVLEFRLITALSSIYAIDISQQNVYEAKQRLFDVIEAAHAFFSADLSPAFDRAINHVLDTNIRLGNTLEDSTSLQFIEYIPTVGLSFERKVFFLVSPEVDLFFVPPSPLPNISYFELGSE